MRVVLYAEGPGERGFGLGPKPGGALPHEHLGAGHVLVGRILAEAGIDELRFGGPLRPQGREARGSDLKNGRLLRQLLSWPRLDLRPDLVVLLIDEDGDSQLRTTLHAETDHLAMPHVFGIPRPEFESWLLADMPAVRAVLATPLPEPAQPEGLLPREARQTLNGWMSGLDAPARRRARVEIAKACDLDEVARACRSFEQFRSELRALAQSLVGSRT